MTRCFSQVDSVDAKTGIIDIVISSDESRKGVATKNTNAQPGSYSKVQRSAEEW